MTEEKFKIFAEIQNLLRNNALRKVNWPKNSYSLRTGRHSLGSIVIILLII